MNNNKSLFQSIDYSLVLYFCILSMMGFLSIYGIEHRPTDPTFFMMDKNYMRQLIWMGVSAVAAIVILLMDSKFFSTFAFLFYAIGVLLILMVFPFGTAVKGSQAWLGSSAFKFQPAEITKVFTALALSRYITLNEIDFVNVVRHRWLAFAMIMIPCALTILQHETGLALVYFAFLIPMYREGLPKNLLALGIIIVVITIVTILVPTFTLFIIYSALLLIFIIVQRKEIKRHRSDLVILFGIWGVCVVFSNIMVPFVFKHVLQAHQIDRIYTLFGQDVPEDYIKTNASGEKVKTGGSEYNVKQSKIAIASGGILGKGLSNGTQTQNNFVPEQKTDFIFCSWSEQFGFWGTTLLLLIYMLLLMRIITIAERQRTQFNRIYAYCVASILFFHLLVNVGMTIGLAPVIGIPLPLMSYGGTSFLTFTILFFILIRFDADKNKILRQG